MEKGPNPMSGHPYRREISSQERESIEVQRQVDRFHKIVESLKRKEELTAEDKNFADALHFLWLPWDDSEGTDYEELERASLESMGLSEKIYSEMFNKISYTDQLGFMALMKARGEKLMITQK